VVITDSILFPVFALRRAKSNVLPLVEGMVASLADRLANNQAKSIKRLITDYYVVRETMHRPKHGPLSNA
jgi:hypothetical protein